MRPSIRSLVHPCDRVSKAEARLERAEEEAARERGLRSVAETSLKSCTDRLEVRVLACVFCDVSLFYLPVAQARLRQTGGRERDKRLREKVHSPFVCRCAFQHRWAKLTGVLNAVHVVARWRERSNRDAETGR